MTQRAVEKMVKKYAMLVVPLKKRMSPHKLRSTYATNLYHETGDIYLVAEALGHADVNTTRKHYASMSDVRMRHAAASTHLLREEPAAGSSVDAPASPAAVSDSPTPVVVANSPTPLPADTSGEAKATEPSSTATTAVGTTDAAGASPLSTEDSLAVQAAELSPATVTEYNTQEPKSDTAIAEKPESGSIPAGFSSTSVEAHSAISEAPDSSAFLADSPLSMPKTEPVSPLAASSPENSDVRQNGLATDAPQPLQHPASDGTPPRPLTHRARAAAHRNQL